MSSAWRPRGCGCAGPRPATPRRSTALARLGGRPLHRAHSPSLSAGLRRALHLRRPRRQRPGARPDPGHDAEEGQARADRLDQPRIARRRQADARVRPRPGALGPGPDHRGDPGGRRGRLRADGGGRDPGQRAGRERGLAARPLGLRLRDRVHGPQGRAGARRPGRVPYRPPDARGLGRGERALARGFPSARRSKRDARHEISRSGARLHPLRRRRRRRGLVPAREIHRVRRARRRRRRRGGDVVVECSPASTR